MPKNYYSFLLRIFKVSSSTEGPWLATLEEPHSQKVINFRNLDMLHKFLTNLVYSRDAGVDNSAIFSKDDNNNIEED
jgi:hypothetical protein